MNKKILKIAAIAMLSVFILTGCKLNKNFNTKNKQNDNLVSESQKTKIDEAIQNEYIRIIDKCEEEHKNGNLKYELVYFNNDDVPELVVNSLGYWVSLYTYYEGKLYNPIDMWGYGVMGNRGYDYIEKSGTIINYNSDYAGAIINKSTLVLNDNFEFDTFTETRINEEIDKKNEMYKDVLEAFEEYGGYYYKGEKTDEEEYNEKIKDFLYDDKEMKTLYGTKSAEEIKMLLKN